MKNIELHVLGYPRIGKNRELKWALEDYWAEKITQGQLIEEANTLKERHWQEQESAGLDWVTVGDFAYYDQVLNMTAYLGAVPKRFQHPSGQPVDLDTYFRMARGRAPKGKDEQACAMKKWFNTNYHYIVPELTEGQTFHVHCASLLGDVARVQQFQNRAKVVLVGPLTYLWLADYQGTASVLDLLPALTKAYGEILAALKSAGVTWVQLDEPILGLNLDASWRQGFEQAYHQLNQVGLNTLVATYFANVAEQVNLLARLPVAGVHIDALQDWNTVERVLDQLPNYRVLSLGVIQGRNIWRGNLKGVYEKLASYGQRLDRRLWLSTTCSLLHCPMDVSQEQALQSQHGALFSFAKQKLEELTLLRHAWMSGGVTPEIQEWQRALDNHVAVQGHASDTPWTAPLKEHGRASAFSKRKQQQSTLNLPVLPTTTIGSFPQTPELRAARKAYRQNTIALDEYEAVIRHHIEKSISLQEALGFDVLVHGEAERNDMVEFFGEQLEGYGFSQFGWVQSYGSRCVKPPIIVSDIHRVDGLTVKWTRYAQSLTSKPVKGMLTGPITMLFWSFPREDVSLPRQAWQLAQALAQEVTALEQEGIRVIQVDEPALREGLPLNREHWKGYLHWAVNAFRYCVKGVHDSTQIHTHMCYSQFNDIIESVADLDADVVTIETSRSRMALLNAFEEFNYPNDIGPGVYDIHTPVVPTVDDMVTLIERAGQCIPLSQLWVNPDCGLKTRGWPETELALRNMIQAAKQVRASLTEEAALETLSC